MSRSTVTITVYPQVDAFARVIFRIAREVLKTERQLKKLRRQAAIQAKQIRRNEYRANRRPALIHNGRKP